MKDCGFLGNLNEKISQSDFLFFGAVAVTPANRSAGQTNKPRCFMVVCGFSRTKTQHTIPVKYSEEQSVLNGNTCTCSACCFRYTHCLNQVLGPNNIIKIP